MLSLGTLIRLLSIMSLKMHPSSLAFLRRAIPTHHLPVALVTCTHPIMTLAFLLYRLQRPLHPLPLQVLALLFMAVWILLAIIELLMLPKRHLVQLLLATTLGKRMRKFMFTKTRPSIHASYAWIVIGAHYSLSALICYAVLTAAN